MPLLPYHLNGSLGTDNAADAAAFAVVEVDLDLAGLLVPGDTEIRTEETAGLAGFACSQTQASLGLLNGLLLGQAHLHGRKTLFRFRRERILRFGDRTAFCSHSLIISTLPEMSHF